MNLWLVLLLNISSGQDAGVRSFRNDLVLHLKLDQCFRMYHYSIVLYIKIKYKMSSNDDAAGIIQCNE
ncbi:hypothetical protein Lalb_Chr21g0304811 [Lupinus albus]|uniref:Uncharacterized protein n=1 Tax=Lupinus albus TaxID=3870 RepID=A0A6A4NR15_LUPAL|nr:hypothetical protein Lalb_Chr21g0304811 [Lupinus albus]